MDLTPKKIILVTGATGYLGSEIVKALNVSDFGVIVLKRASSDLSRLQSIKSQLIDCYDLEQGIEALFEKHKIAGIIHCATDYGRGGSSPFQIAETNIMLPLSLLSCGLRHQLEFFINTGTLLDKSTNDYSLSKCQFEEWLQRYSSQLVCINLALEHFYGLDRDKSKFVTWLIQQTLAGKHIPLTAGEQNRDFLFISDVVDAYITVLGHISTFKKGYHSFEVGSGNAIKIKDLVMQISDTCAPHSATYGFGEVPYRANERMDSKLDIGPLSRLGWSQKISLAEGLKRTVNAIKENQKIGT